MGYTNYIKLFKSKNEYNEFSKSNNLPWHNVSIVSESDEVFFNDIGFGLITNEEIIENSLKYFTIVNKSNNDAYLNINKESIVNQIDYYDNISSNSEYNYVDLYYKIGESEWSILNDEIKIEPYQEVFIKGECEKNTNVRCGNIKLSGDGICSVKGNIMSLVFGDNFSNKKDLSGYDYIFNNLLSNNSINLIDVSKLILPAKILSPYCYSYMFYGCDKIKRSPVLSTKTLYEGCYSHIFYGCKRLNQIIMLATNTNADKCLENWIGDISINGTIYKDNSFDITLDENNGLLDNWNSKYYEIIDYTEQYFTIENNSESILSISLKKGSSTQTLTYRQPNSDEWLSSLSVNVDIGKKIQLKGNYTISTSYGIGTFKINGGNFSVKGNIMSLVFGDNFSDKVDLTSKNYVFRNLLQNCTSLVDASDLVLPATTLANSCYYYMFYGCTSLKTAPELPATTLANNCYYYMFYGCTSLKTAPELPATTLKDNCYSGMFNGCTSLTTALELPATTLASSCYYGMFRGCTSLTTALELPATTLASSCYYGMFNGCTSLTTAPELPATTLASSCYSNMFYGCTSLKTAPELPATTLASSCYYGMFNGCTSLTTAPELPATTLKDSCYYGMFNGCTSLTSAPELPATTLAYSCYYGMFYNCTSLTSAPELPATTLANNCYYYMFNGCTSLTTALELPATTLKDSCYYGMFNGCTSLTSAPELPATTLASWCYREMFQGCTSLTTAPKLPATYLASYCYSYMFYGCSKLNKITMLASDISARNCLYYWVYGVSSSGTFGKHPSMTSLPFGNDGIPNGWAVENDYSIFNIVCPSIINSTNNDITFYYSNGLYNPSSSMIQLYPYYTINELLSFKPQCDIYIDIFNDNGYTLISNYLWDTTKTLENILSSNMGISAVLNIGISILKVITPEYDSYYYYQY